MTTIEPIGCTEHTAHKERETLRLKVNEIIEALNGISINNAKITLKQGSAIKGDFTLNQPIDKTIELDAGGSAGGFVWGEGTGIIDDQADLKEKFDGVWERIVGVEDEIGEIDDDIIDLENGTVKNSGDETIGGTKTFTGLIRVKRSGKRGNALLQTFEDFDITNPSDSPSGEWGLFQTEDVNNANLFHLYVRTKSNGGIALVADMRDPGGTHKDTIIATNNLWS